MWDLARGIVSSDGCLSSDSSVCGVVLEVCRLHLQPVRS